MSGSAELQKIILEKQKRNDFKYNLQEEVKNLKEKQKGDHDVRCEECDYKTKRKQNLRDHIKAKHESITNP